MFDFVIITILTLLLTISIYYNVKFGIFILKIQDSIEECLDALDEKYAIFSKILEKPVFFDSVEVRQVIQEIKSCQDLILKIANVLSKPGGLLRDEEKIDQ